MRTFSNVLVTVRFSSSRLPGKCMLLVDGLPVLHHLINRLLKAGLIPIVCTSSDVSDEPIVNFCKSNNVNYFRGSLLNKIQRWANCADELTDEYIHIIDGDDPLVDTDEIKESLFLAQSQKLDLLRTSPKSDSGFASVGMSVRRSYLNVLSNRTVRLKSNDLDVIPWNLLIHQEDHVHEKSDKFLINDKSFKVRLTLDYEEDFLLISHLISSLGATSAREVIEKYLFNNPKLVNLNLGRSMDFIENKKKQLKSNFDLG